MLRNLLLVMEKSKKTEALREYVTRAIKNKEKDVEKTADSKVINDQRKKRKGRPRKERNPAPQEQTHQPNEIHPEPLKVNVDKVPLKFYKTIYKQHSSTTSSSSRTKNIFEMDDIDGEPNFGGNKRKVRRYQKKKHRSVFSCSTSRSDKCSEEPSRKKKTIDIPAYKKLISTYMKNIQLTIEKNQTISTEEAWKNLQGASTMYEKKAAEEKAPPPEEEQSETEMLFGEMDLCLAAACYEDEVKIVKT